MCIKIVRALEEQEFNPSEPLENQIEGAKEIVISYDPIDLKIPSFVGQLELMVKNGIDCGAEIRVNANNQLNGMKLKKEVEKLKRKLDVNLVVKSLAKINHDVDCRLGEIFEMCSEKNNER